MATADQLKQVLAETLSPFAETRKAAEARLIEAQKSQSHHLAVLKLVASSDGGVDLAIRQAAAVHFKNTVKKGWDVNREDGNEGIVISDADRETIKSHLVQLMCTVPPKIQAMLSESISLIAAVDFPAKWENLLPELVSQFNAADPTVVVGVLKTANSIFKAFRHVQRSDALYAKILFSLNIIQAPLTALFKSTGQAVQSLANDPAQLKPRFEALRLICRIFYSLNYQDLPEYFEDHMNEWMTEFAAYLQYENSALTDPDEEQVPSPIDKLQAAIIDVLSLYADKDEEPFMPFLPTFTEMVWNLLMKVTSYPKQDLLATKSIKFLSSLVEKIMHKNLFQNEATLRQIVLKIVIPNLTFRESDMERFEDDPREYIVTEVEGSDSESRRKCSQVLLRAMCRHFEAETTKICEEHVGSMLKEYDADPNNKWAAKDAAIHLMMGISIKTESSFIGVTQINEGVNVMDFFMTQILSELQDTNHSSRPVVKATSIKFVSVFRNQFSRENLIQLMPMLIAHLASPVVVVHTFAAYAIERVLVTKQEAAPGGAKVAKFGRAELKAFVEPMFTGLFAIVDNTQWDENDYVMKCVMRSLATAGEDVIPVTQNVISKLTEALGRVAKNPLNPQFNHYLFESIAVLVRSVCSKDPSQTSLMEPLLFTPFNIILQHDITEFTPYVFQVLAQLLEYRPSEQGLGEAYRALFPPLLTPTVWENKGNIPALARLLQAYIRQAAPELAPHLLPILGVFQKLVAAKSSEVSGFDILNSAIVHFPQESMEPQILKIFEILLVRLTSGKTPRFTRLITTFFALFVGKYGAQTFFDRMNAMQPGLGVNLLCHVWSVRLKTDPPVQKLEAKIQVVGATKVLCESPTLLADAEGQKAWTSTLVGVITLLVSDTFQKVAEATTVDDEPEMETGYDAQFSKLMYAKKEVEDPFPEVADPRALFVQSLHGVLSGSNGGQFMPLVHAGLSVDPKLGSGLDAMFQNAGLRLG